MCLTTLRAFLLRFRSEGHEILHFVVTFLSVLKYMTFRINYLVHFRTDLLGINVIYLKTEVVVTVLLAINLLLS
jgi:hypothetical protein